MTVIRETFDATQPKDAAITTGGNSLAIDLFTDPRNFVSAGKGTDTASAHLAPVTVVDDSKACPQEGFWSKLWREAKNATIDGGYGEMGMQVPPGSHFEPSCKAGKPSSDMNSIGGPGDILPPLSLVPDGKDPLNYERWTVPGPGQDNKSEMPPAAPGQGNIERTPADKQPNEGPDNNLHDVPGAPKSAKVGPKQPIEGPDNNLHDLPGVHNPSDITVPGKPNVEHPPSTEAPPSIEHPPSSDKPSRPIPSEPEKPKEVPGPGGDIQKFLGQTPGDIQPGINPRLGCALMVSHVLHEADPSFPVTNNSATLRRLLKEHGYEAVTVKPGDAALGHTQAGDVLVGQRPDGMPSHAALSVGDGKVFNNNSDAGKTQIDSLDQFNQGMHDKSGHWNKNGFSDVTIFRKKAQPAVSELSVA